MILQSLNRYYERAENMPHEGWVRRGVDYVLVLDQHGTCVAIESIGEPKKNKLIPRDVLVPAIGKQVLKHTNSGNDANLLWDNASFVFGTGNKGAGKLNAFISTLRDWLGEVTDPGLTAVVTFCERVKDSSDVVPALVERFGFKDDFDKRDPVLVFRLTTDVEYVHFRPAVRSAYETKLGANGADGLPIGNCLVSGKQDVPLALNESVIKGVWGGQPAGCNIVSFNARAFESYGKKDRNGENAPISASASFSYTTALNHLLASQQRTQIGDASTVFWAEEPHDLEAMVPNLFGEPKKDDPNAGTAALQKLYSAVHTGKFAVGKSDDRFHVLGLAPNAARISIRFWETEPAIVLAKRIAKHFDDIQITHADFDREHLPLPALLKASSRRKSDGSYDIPPRLGGDVLHTIMAGENLPFPAEWLGQTLQRCRADQAKKNATTGKPVRHVNYERAAIIKACINRNIRWKQLSEKGMTVGLDKNCKDLAYRLGRLFVTYERIQEISAERELNRSILAAYYGAAMTTPRVVFPRLMRLNQHHMRDLRRRNPGIHVYFDKLLQEIGDGIPAPGSLPATMNLENQGKFTIGYYHQRQEFYASKSNSEADETIESTEGEPQ